MKSSIKVILILLFFLVLPKGALGQYCEECRSSSQELTSVNNSRNRMQDLLKKNVLARDKFKKQKNFGAVAKLNSNIKLIENAIEKHDKELIALKGRVKWTCQRCQ